jgi:hypothetical protein
MDFRGRGCLSAALPGAAGPHTATRYWLGGGCVSASPVSGSVKQQHELPSALAAEILAPDAIAVREDMPTRQHLEAEAMWAEALAGFSGRTEIV